MQQESENGAGQSGKMSAPVRLERALPDEAATQALGAALAAGLQTDMTLPAASGTQGLHIFLTGDLGAGKTALTRALLRALGHSGTVKSPTYTLVETYHVNSTAGHALKLCHFDFYRFQSPDEFSDAGLEEYFQGDAVCLVEWPDKAAGAVGFPAAPDVEIVLAHVGAGRHACLTACSRHGQAYLQSLQTTVPPAVS